LGDGKFMNKFKFAVLILAAAFAPVAFAQAVSATLIGTRPSETLIYASNMMKMPIAVATPPKGRVWFVENGKITKSDSKK